MKKRRLFAWFRGGEPAPERAAPVMPLRPRKMNFPFGTHIPRCWFAGSVLSTHTANGLNLLFPEGERYFIRSVRRFEEVARRDPELWERASGFMAQEVRHGLEHKRFFATLEAQGFALSGFLELFEDRFFPWLEGTLSPELLLAGTVALEHYTAALGEVVLTTSLLEGADKDVGDLLRWHAAEEIEHKSVAFDVLEAAGIPYTSRMLGFTLATLGLFGWWALATGMLLEQERGLQAQEAGAPGGQAPRGRQAAQLLRGLVDHGVAQALLRSVGEYLRPDFHPDQRDNYELARGYLASVGQAA